MTESTTVIDWAIIGGGISGLATAWFLRQRGYSVRVFEAAAEVGGTLRSRTQDGFLIEQGPNSTLENTDALGELIRGVHLEAALQVANPASKQRYILQDRQLVPLPLGPAAFFRTPLFSARGKLRLLAEPFIGQSTEEESIATFVRRRLGQEFLDWAIDPFVSGVYAGDPERLSVRAATAKIYKLEAEHGSLIKGMVHRALTGKRSGPSPKGRLIAFSGGMQTLARGVAAALGPEQVCTRSPLLALEREEATWCLRIAPDGATVRARSVVLCLPAAETANLLAPLAPEAVTALRNIPYPTVASVALGFRREQVRHPLDGFGFLIPKRCGIETLGTLFSSSLFLDRAPSGQILLTSFLGGTRHPAVGMWSADKILQTVLQDISPVLGIQGPPLLNTVMIWPRAIPQYELGHLDRIAKIDQSLTELPGLHTRANWRDGISVADCVRNARDFAAGSKLSTVD